MIAAPERITAPDDVLDLDAELIAHIEDKLADLERKREELLERQANLDAAMYALGKEWDSYNATRNGLETALEHLKKSRAR